MSKIQYKSLEKSLSMLCKVSITENTALNEEDFIRFFSVEIFPHKTSFWSGNQNIEIIRKSDSSPVLANSSPDAFAQQASAILHQLTFKLGLNGVPIAVERQNELWQKWLNIRDGLINGYAGEWVESALTEIDLKMLPGETLIHYVMQVLFFNEYFRNVYDASFIENNFYCKRTVHGLCPFPIRFNEKWLHQNSITGQSINFSGKWDNITDQSGFDNWLKTKTNDCINEIRVDGNYQLDQTTGWCNGLESCYSISTNSYKKTMTINLIPN